MIPFFRKIRKKLADDNRPLKYMRYAVGEIVLVVIGILIALQINTWNEQRMDRQITNRLLENVQKELLNNIKEADLATDFYRLKDSLIYKVFNKKVTSEDLKSNSSLTDILYSRYRVDITQDAYKKLIDFDGKIPKELDSIFIKLKEVHGPDWVSIHKNNKLIDDLLRSNMKEIENNNKWFADYFYSRETPEDMIAYQLNDTIYRNRVANYSIVHMNHFNRTRAFRNKALSIYEKISDYLDLKKDTTVVKNIDDYQHYIGRYEGENLFDAHIIRKDDTLKLNIIAKNDTIIIESIRVYPDSKSYFTAAYNSFIAASESYSVFGQLFFDQDNKISKLVLSQENFREELKKMH